MCAKNLFPFCLLLLFGCDSSFKGNVATIPYFSEISNSVCRVEPIELDSGFYVGSFIIAPDKKHIYILASRHVGNLHQLSLSLLRWDTQLLQLDSAGHLEKKIRLLENSPQRFSAFWWTSDNHLAITLPSLIRMYDPNTLQPVEDWPIYDKQNACSEKQRQVMSGDKLDELYTQLIQKAFRQSQSAYVYSIPSGQHFLFLQFADHPPEAWHINTRLQDERAYIRKFGQRVPLLNPDAPLSGSYSDLTEGDYMRDGQMHLRCIEHKILEEKVGLMNAEIRIFDLSNGKKTLQFKSSSLEPHHLDLQFAENKYLTTKEDTGWMIYENQLYRVEMNAK